MFRRLRALCRRSDSGLAKDLCSRFGDIGWDDLSDDERAWWCAHAAEILR